MADPLPADRYPDRDEDVPRFVGELGIPGIVDIHVHVLPERLQQAVWRYFDRLEAPPWPITYRAPEPARRRTLAALGVIRHTALAYAHQPGMAAALNDHTLALADDPRIIPTFTLHAEDGVGDYVAAAIARGGQVAKVHLQVGRFHATDPRLDPAWELLAAHRIPVVLHAGAVYGVDGGHEFCGADGVRALLERHPELVLVVAHLGAPDHVPFLRLAEDVPTLRMDLSMALTDPPYLTPYPADCLARLRALSGRLLFGSDFPTIPHPYAAQVRGLRRLELDRGALAAVLHDNATALLAAVR